MRLRKGDRLKVRYGDRVVDAEVALASDNGRSLMLSFEAILGGYVGSMPVLGETAEGPFTDLVEGRPVAIALVQRAAS